MFLSSQALAFAGGLLSLCTLYSALSPLALNATIYARRFGNDIKGKSKTVIHVVVSY